MKTKVVFIIIIFLIILSSCSILQNTSTPININYGDEIFNNSKKVRMTTQDFELAIYSESNFIENEEIEFTSILKFIGDQSVKFDGGDLKVGFSIYDSNGDMLISNYGTDLSYSKQISPNEEFVEHFLVKSLNAGEYFLDIETCWIRLDGKYHKGIGYEEPLKEYKKRYHNSVYRDLTTLIKSKIVIRNIKFKVNKIK